MVEQVLYLSLCGHEGEKPAAPEVSRPQDHSHILMVFLEYSCQARKQKAYDTNLYSKQ